MMANDCLFNITFLEGHNQTSDAPSRFLLGVVKRITALPELGLEVFTMILALAISSHDTNTDHFHSENEIPSFSMKSLPQMFRMLLLLPTLPGHSIQKLQDMVERAHHLAEVLFFNCPTYDPNCELFINHDDLIDPLPLSPLKFLK